MHDSWHASQVDPNTGSVVTNPSGQEVHLSAVPGSTQVTHGVAHTRHFDDAISPYFPISQGNMQFPFSTIKKFSLQLKHMVIRGSHSSQFVAGQA